MATYLRRRAQQSGLHDTAATLAFPAPELIRLTMHPRRCQDLPGNALLRCLDASLVWVRPAA
jgi:hypothetical protein